MVERITQDFVDTTTTTSWRPCKLIQVKVSCSRNRSSSGISEASTQDETVSSTEHFDSEGEVASPSSFCIREHELVRQKTYTNDYEQRTRLDSLSTCSSLSLSVLAYDFDYQGAESEDFDDESTGYVSCKKPQAPCFWVGGIFRALVSELTCRLIDSRSQLWRSRR